MNTLRKALPLLLLSAATASAGGGVGYFHDIAPAYAISDHSEKQDIAATCYFSGIVVDESGKPVTGASVAVNGISRTTTSNGEFYLSVTCASTGNNMLNAKASGKVPVSQVYVESTYDIRIVMRAAYTQSINPMVDNVVKDPATGATLTLLKNTLISSTGTTPTGNVTVTVGYYTPGTMAGDLTAQNASNTQVFLESVGALHIGVSDSTGKSFNLKSGATATAFIPVPSEYNKQMPSCVSAGTCRLAMWRYNTTNGMWYEKSAALSYSSTGTTFTMVGDSASVRQGEGTQLAAPIASNGGLGDWNADIEKQNPACTVVKLIDFDSKCYNPASATIEPGITFKISFPTTSGKYTDQTRSVGSDSAAFLLYNIIENKDMKLSLTLPSGAPSSCSSYSIAASPLAATSGYTVNSGARWGGTGYPKRPSDGKSVTLQDIDSGNHPCKSTVTVQAGTWSGWYDLDNTTGNGDYELLSSIVKKGLSCTQPSKIECQTISGKDWTQTGEVYTCEPTVGGYCENSKQPDGSCQDYQVRFLCP